MNYLVVINYIRFIVFGFLGGGGGGGGCRIGGFGLLIFIFIFMLIFMLLGVVFLFCKININNWFDDLFKLFNGLDFWKKIRMRIFRLNV